MERIVPNPYVDTITLWVRGAANGYGGYNHAGPIQILGRWEDTQEDFVAPNGDVKLSKAVIYVPDAGQTIPSIGDFLQLGTQAGAPSVNAGAFEVRQLVKTPDMRRVRYEIRVVL